MTAATKPQPEAPAVERERPAGRFPAPTLRIGKAPLWTREALEQWIAEGGGQ